MSTASPSLPIVARRAAWWRPPAEVGALARIEGRRLLRHPVLLGGVLLSALLVWALASSDGQGQAFALSGWVLLPVALGTMVAANLGALRSRRDGTDELYGSLPRPRSSRTAGQLLGLAWSLPICGVLLALSYVAFDAREGLVVSRTGLRHTPALVELAQGPLLVVALGALGILLARAAPTPVIAPVLVVVIFVAETVLAQWGPKTWLVPLANDTIVQPDSWGICEPGDTVPRCNLVLGRDLPGMTWHLTYVAGLTVLAGAGAVIRGRRRLAVLAALAAALALATALGAG